MTPYSPDTHCAKCNFALDEVTHAAGRHRPCPLWDHETYDRQVNACLSSVRLGLGSGHWPEVPHVPEHLCRKCLRCGYRWAEDVL